MGPDDMRTVAAFIARAVEHREDEAQLAALRQEVEEFAGAFPVPGITDRTPAPA
jgi:glycine/serine hydroxymethyltransferase